MHWSFQSSKPDKKLLGKKKKDAERQGERNRNTERWTEKLREKECGNILQSTKHKINVNIDGCEDLTGELANQRVLFL